jgi:hypothetical protein
MCMCQIAPPAGPTREYARLLGQCRRAPERCDLPRIRDDAALWLLLLHCAREPLPLAVPGAAAPRSLHGQSVFRSWLEELMASSFIMVLFETIMYISCNDAHAAEADSFAGFWLGGAGQGTAWP